MVLQRVRYNWVHVHYNSRMWQGTWNDIYFNFCSCFAEARGSGPPGLGLQLAAYTPGTLPSTFHGFPHLISHPLERWKHLCGLHLRGKETEAQIGLLAVKQHVGSGVRIWTQAFWLQSPLLENSGLVQPLTSLASMFTADPQKPCPSHTTSAPSWPRWCSSLEPPLSVQRRHTDTPTPHHLVPTGHLCKGCPLLLATLARLGVWD